MGPASISKFTAAENNATLQNTRRQSLRAFARAGCRACVRGAAGDIRRVTAGSGVNSGAAAAPCGSSPSLGSLLRSGEQEIVRVQGGQRNMLQRRDDIRSIGYHDVGPLLRDVAVCHCLIEGMIRKARELDNVALRSCTMGLEIMDHIASALSGSDHESVVALASEELVIAGTAVDHEFDLAALER